VGVGTTGDSAQAGPARGYWPVSPGAPLVNQAVITASAGTVVISGELDVSNRAELAGQLEQIAAAAPGRLIFDLTAVTFIDCASLRLIVTSNRLLAGQQDRVVVRPSPVVRRVLDVTGFLAICEIDNS
jgi:anti-anti-sigma factor